jgi:ribosomal protein S18 acetylase RimI-like enzyme
MFSVFIHAKRLIKATVWLSVKGEEMELKPTKKYSECVLLGEESMRSYFIENKIPWDFEKRLELYLSFEIYEVIETESIGYLALRENEGDIFIADIQILDGYRNKGYGTQLLKMAKEIARSRGYVSIKLKVFKSSPALELYTRNGYVKVSEENFVYVLSANT